MSFKKKWNGKRKKEKPNSLRAKPTMAFRTNLSPITLAYMKDLSKKSEKSNFINQAIEQRYFFATNKKQYLIRMIAENYNYCRFMLRKIGGEKKSEEILKSYGKQ